ncbi:MAG: TatD family hydrolase [Bacillota bacterium]
MKGTHAYPLVDSHAHLDFHDFDRDRETVLQRAEAAGVELIINVGFDLDSSRKAVQLAARYSTIYAAVGIHPHDAAAVPDDYLGQLEALAAAPKVVALGEMGLDFYRDRSPRPQQKKVFREQLALARRLDMPVILHDRDAHDGLMAILQKEGLPRAGGVLHCFSGDLSLAREAMALGLYISIAGPVTYPRNSVLRAVAAAVPAENLLLETDAPFLAPGPWRGRRNEPAYVNATAEAVASLRGCTAAELGSACLANAKRLFLHY